jgi:hypothetical protein
MFYCTAAAWIFSLCSLQSSGRNFYQAKGASWRFKNSTLGTTLKLACLESGLHLYHELTAGTVARQMFESNVFTASLNMNLDRFSTTNSHNRHMRHIIIFSMNLIMTLSNTIKSTYV